MKYRDKARYSGALKRDAIVRTMKFPAFIGKSDGTIADTSNPNNVWIRTQSGGLPLSVFNDKVLNVWNTPVWVGYNEYDNLHLRILAPRDVFTNPIVAMPPNMASALVIDGPNPLIITPQMYTPWLVRWSGIGLTIEVYGMAFLTPTGYQSPLITSQDLTSHVPGTAGSRWVLVCVNSSGVITYTDGSIVAPITLADIPATPLHSMALSAVRLDYGQTVFLWSTTTTSFLDLRYSGEDTNSEFISALTGEVTAIGPGSVAATITDSAVTNAKLADMAQATIKGRAAGAGTGVPVDLTAAQVAAIITGLLISKGNSTLTSGTTTTVTDASALTTSVIVIQSTSAAITLLGVYVSAKGAGSFTLTHGIAAGTETFDYIVIN